MELVRKSIHMGAIVLALLFRFSWFQYWMAMAMAILALLFNLFLMPRLGRRLFRPGEDVPPTGMLLYPLSVFLLVLLFWAFGGAPHVAAAAWSLMALGDGLSTLAGRSLGRHRLPWNPQKTYIGLLTFFLGGTFGVAFMLWFVSPRTGVEIPWHQAYLLALPVAFVAGVVETFPWRINDNLSVPLIGGAVIYLLDAVEGRLISDLFADPWKVFAFILLTTLLAAIAYYKELIELPSAIAGWFMGFLMLLFAGLAGFCLLVIYFIALELITRYRMELKESRGLARKRGGSYAMWNSIATVGVALFLAFWGAVTLHTAFFWVAMVAALATAFADTVATELGQLHGGRPFLLPSFRRVPVGTPGAISFVGTTFGILAALAVAVVAQICGLFPSPIFIAVVTVAAFVGTTWESAFGPSLIRRRFGPHTMNFICTLVGVLAAMVLYWLF